MRALIVGAVLAAVATETASAAPIALPVRARLLVEAPAFGLAIVEDRRVRRLGEWYDAAWSPDGTRIAGTDGRRLAVLGDSGRVRWKIRRTAPTQPDWSPDGRRIAYRSGGRLRVVGADGRDDRVAASGLRFAGPRWGPRGELAWADRRGRVHVAGRWTSPPGAPVRPGGLHWSADGSALAAISGTVVRVFDGARGTLVRRVRTRPRDHFQFGVFAANRLVLVRHDFTRGWSRVTSVRSGVRERTVFAGRGSVVGATPSPDGRSVLLSRRTRDSWEIRPLTGDAPPRAVRHVTRRVNPRATGLWAFPVVRGWRVPR